MSKKKKEEKKKASKKKSNKKEEKKSKKEKSKKNSLKKEGKKAEKKKVATPSTKKLGNTVSKTMNPALVKPNLTVVEKGIAVRKSIDFTVREAVVELRKLTTAAAISTFVKGDDRITVLKAVQIAKRKL